MPSVHTILLVEDDENDVFLFERALRKAGVTNPLVVVHDGREAVDLLEASQQGGSTLSGPPGLMLLDLKMPRMNGFEVLAWLQNQPALKLLPAVVFSSSCLEADIRKARELGAAEYCVKPSSTAEMVAMIQQLHGRWLQPGTEAHAGQA